MCIDVRTVVASRIIERGASKAGVDPCMEQLGGEWGCLHVSSAAGSRCRGEEKERGVKEGREGWQSAENALAMNSVEYDGIGGQTPECGVGLGPCLTRDLSPGDGRERKFEKSSP